MKFVDIQKRQWDKDYFEKLAYYCNTKLFSYFGIEYLMVYSALNCRIKKMYEEIKYAV